MSKEALLSISVEELSYAIEETCDIVANLESIAISLRDTLKTGGTLGGPGFAMFNCAMDSNLKRLGIQYINEMPSLEMFTDPVTTRGATRIALESVVSSIGDALKRVWEWVKELFAKLAKWLGISVSKKALQDKKLEDIKNTLKAAN